MLAKFRQYWPKIREKLFPFLVREIEKRNRRR